MSNKSKKEPSGYSNYEKFSITFFLGMAIISICAFTYGMVDSIRNPQPVTPNAIQLTDENGNALSSEDLMNMSEEDLSSILLNNGLTDVAPNELKDLATEEPEEVADTEEGDSGIVVQQTEDGVHIVNEDGEQVPLTLDMLQNMTEEQLNSLVVD